MVKFIDVSNADMEKIHDITMRAIKEKLITEHDRLGTIMDLMAAHQDTPLDLDLLSKFTTGNLAHDIYGIRRHLNR